MVSALRPGNYWGSLSPRALGTWEGALAARRGSNSILALRLAGPRPFRTRVVFLAGEKYLRCHLVPEFRSLGRGTSVLQLEVSQQSCLPRPGRSPFTLDTPLVLFLRTGTYLQLPKLAVLSVLPIPASKFFRNCRLCERVSDEPTDRINHFLFVSPLVLNFVRSLHHTVS